MEKSVLRETVYAFNNDIVAAYDFDMDVWHLIALNGIHRMRDITL